MYNMLPGPTSTQMLSALAYRKGGVRLAYLTLLIWLAPAFVLMLGASIVIHYLIDYTMLVHLTRFLRPVAVAFIAYAAFILWRRVVKGPLAHGLVLASACLSFVFTAAYVLPLLVFGGGIIHGYWPRPKAFSPNTKTTTATTSGLSIRWRHLFIYGAVFLGISILARLNYNEYLLFFENFYTKGSIIFGGGQVFIPFLLTEFTETKASLSLSEFLTGFALMQGLPGPLFAFSAYVGSLSFRGSPETQLLGGLIATAGIFLPGMFLLFFAESIWKYLKALPLFKHALVGIHAVGVGLLSGAGVKLFLPFHHDEIAILSMLIAFLLMCFTRIPPIGIALTSLLLGVLLP